jgi:hypothetical protein|tara:strand:+ start:93 stop:440 length:348 start_codon:yes stop_codon:yes gene_type:complete
MPYADRLEEALWKDNHYQKTKKFRRRVKLLVFYLRGCAGTLTEKCKWQGRISHVSLQYDHRDGEVKRCDINRMDGYSIKTIKTEMRKCDVVCANCHAIRTEQRRLKNVKRTVKLT